MVNNNCKVINLNLLKFKFKFVKEVTYSWDFVREKRETIYHFIDFKLRSVLKWEQESASPSKERDERYFHPACKAVYPNSLEFF